MSEEQLNNIIATYRHDVQALENQIENHEKTIKLIHTHEAIANEICKNPDNEITICNIFEPC